MEGLQYPSIFDPKAAKQKDSNKVSFNKLEKTGNSYRHTTYSEYVDHYNTCRNLSSDMCSFFKAAQKLGEEYVGKELASLEVIDHSLFRSRSLDPRLDNTRKRIGVLRRVGLVFQHLLDKSDYA